MSATKEKTKAPLVPGGPWKEEELLVCRYNGIAYCVFCLGSLALAIAISLGGFIECGIIFVIPGIVFGLYVTRCVLIFYPGGVVYRGVFGKVYRFKDEDVLYVTSGGGGKSRYFAIIAKDDVIQLGVQARNFNKAEQCAYDRYPNKEEYERRNNEA